MEIGTLLTKPWQAPAVPENIAHGDMPGDRVCIGEEHIQKAATLFPELRDLLLAALTQNPHERAVVAVCGGSGVGKSEIASVLSYYLNELGVGSRVISGDNYPRRIPRDNDAERVRVFRCGGLRGLLDAGVYERAQADALRALWESDADADPAMTARYPWLAAYQQAGRKSLSSYLGTKNEIDFDEVSAILARFKRGENRIAFKRMGREATELWYDVEDVTGTRVLIIEWTHGNSDFIDGVDIPILLNSTPEETLAHRRARGRDGKTDSPFTTMVLEIEQGMLQRQAPKAKLILSKAGELMSYETYCQTMNGTQEGKR